MRFVYCLALLFSERVFKIHRSRYTSKYLCAARMFWSVGSSDKFLVFFLSFGSYHSHSYFLTKGSEKVVKLLFSV